MTTNSAPAPLADSTTQARRRRPARAPRTRHDDAGPDTVRRRDGVTLAATGRLPDRVRARVLAEHYTAMGARSRSGTAWRVEVGIHPLTIPYGYRRIGITNPAGLGEANGYGGYSGVPGLWWGPDRLAHDAWFDRRARAGRAKACAWEVDRPAARAVEQMAAWARDGITLREIATRLGGDRSCPPPLTATRALAWTPRLVRAVLTDPAVTGYSVWGRTRQGRAVAPAVWIVSSTMTHPQILSVPLWHTTCRAIDPAPSGPGDQDSDRADRAGITRPWWAP